MAGPADHLLIQTLTHLVERTATDVDNADTAGRTLLADGEKVLATRTRETSRAQLEDLLSQAAAISLQVHDLARQATLLTLYVGQRTELGEARADYARVLSLYEMAARYVAEIDRLIRNGVAGDS